MFIHLREANFQSKNKQYLRRRVRSLWFYVILFIVELLIKFFLELLGPSTTALHPAAMYKQKYLDNHWKWDFQIETSDFAKITTCGSLLYSIFV